MVMGDCRQYGGAFVLSPHPLNGRVGRDLTYHVSYSLDYSLTPPPYYLQSFNMLFSKEC